MIRITNPGSNMARVPVAPLVSWSHVAQREVPHDVEQGALERVWRQAQVKPDDDGIVDWVQTGDHALLGWHHEVPRAGVLQVDDAKRGGA
jgi:hypothetical protein